MNWGHKLTAAIIAFMGFIIVLIVSLHFNRTELVSKDYYQQELEYQKTIDAKVNTSELEGEFLVLMTANYLGIELPKELQSNPSTKGEILLYRPDNSANDLVIKIALGDKRIWVPKDKLNKGIYVIKVTCKVNGKAYYFEKQVRL